MTVLDHQSYRTYLKSVLAETERTNPAFSLRAFALKLDLAPSYLSAILKGKKNLSHERAMNLASRLKLKAKEQEYFCLLVQIESTADPALKESYLKRAQSLNPRTEIQNLSLDHFKVISDWYHFAILTSTELSNTEITAQNLTKLLGLSKPEAELALERLERLEMLEKDENGHYQKTNSNPRFVSESPNAALRKFHSQTLTKAIESLETQSPKEKIIGSETFAIDSGLLEEFRDLTERFFNEATALAQKSKKKDQVYHLGLQFFKFTQNSFKEKK